jgi:hypothetical protein
VTGGWRKLHNEKLHDLYSLPSIIRMVKSRRMRCEEHVTHIGKRGMHVGFCWESRKEGDHWKDLNIGGSIILRLILEKGRGGMDWIYLAQDRDPWRALVNMVMKM